MKKTLVFGASTNPERYSYMATEQLLAKGHKVVLVGLKEGEIFGQKIKTGHPKFRGIDTITLYVGPENQVPHYEYLLALKPKRIIFNPGTENIDFAQMAKKVGIETEFACTLVQLSIGNY